MATLKQQKKRAKKVKKSKKTSSSNMATKETAYEAPEEDLTPEQEVEFDKKAPIKRETVKDAITSFLAKCDDAKSMIAKVKNSKYFKNINRKAFDKTAKEAKNIQFGLLRMRMGNLLRGAIRNAEKAKQKKSKKK